MVSAGFDASEGAVEPALRCAREVSGDLDRRLDFTPYVSFNAVGPHGRERHGGDPPNQATTRNVDHAAAGSSSTEVPVDRQRMPAA